MKGKIIIEYFLPQTSIRMRCENERALIIMKKWCEVSLIVLERIYFIFVVNLKECIGFGRVRYVCLE